MVSNQDPDLSADARRIIDEARGFDDPTPEDRDRVKTRWLASIAAVAGVSSLAEAVRAAGGIGWGVKAVGAALGIAAGAAGLYAVFSPADGRGTPPRNDEVANVAAASGQSRNGTNSEAAPDQAEAVRGGSPGGTQIPSEIGGLGSVDGRTTDATLTDGSSEQIDAPRQPVAALHAVDSLPIQTPRAPRREPASPRAAMEPTGAPTVGGQRPPGSGTPAALPSAAAENSLRGARASSPLPVQAAAKPSEQGSAAPSGQLGEELSMLSRIRSSVQEGAPSRALELISSYRERFDRPILGMEADALRVDALCRTGQREAAQASAKAFRKDWPGSPLEQRVSSACP